MIPIELKLRNFMAYQEATLPFQGIHLAALTGENGAGKSSLLDAITWAMWGKARARRDDELIRLGQTEMEVEFCFVLNDNTYRIIRKRDSNKRGRSSLDFHVAEAGGWRTLSESSLRATNQKIIDLLRLDYSTFINSAFLLQGRADEFTTKTPGERKQILSDILSLDVYDAYANGAKKRAVEKEKEAATIEGNLERIDEELARESEYRTNLVEAEKEAAGHQEALLAAEQKMQTLRDQYRAINDKQRQLDDLRDRLSGAEADLTELAETIEAAQASIERCQVILGRRAEIEAGLAELQQAQAAVKDWEQRLQESAKLSSRKHELDSAFQAARARVEADLREVTTTINMVEPKAVALESVQSQLEQAEADLERLQTLEQEREEQRQALAELDKETSRLETQNIQLKKEMEEIKENLTQLEQAGSTCPVCQQPLEETHRTEVLAQFQQEGTTKGDRWRDNRIRLSEIKKQQTQLQQQVQTAGQQLRGLGPAQRKAARLQQTLQEAEAARVELVEAQARQTELQQQLETRSFAAPVLADLAEVEAELAELGYDRAAHSQAQEEVERLTPFAEESRALTEAEKRLEEEQKRLAREEARRSRLLEQSAADRERAAVLEEETAGLAELVTGLNQASARVDELQRQLRFAQDKASRARQMLDHIAYQAKERGKQEEKLAQTREAISLYRELQLAFGKKGVQALLIESAIPEIEEEANRLLSRMTDGRMHIRFETQREAKTTDSTIETLDIRISDEMGTRDYELYSGGEAFRINFAIRVAISKVLARRAGARLQTLMIDEGFGTQDVQGRERLVEAITAIQDDFEKLIIITHIDELKDAFPVRIDVWKTPQGSQVAIR